MTTGGFAIKVTFMSTPLWNLYPAGISALGRVDIGANSFGELIFIRERR